MLSVRNVLLLFFAPGPSFTFPYCTYHLGMLSVRHFLLTPRPFFYIPIPPWYAQRAECSLTLFCPRPFLYIPILHIPPWYAQRAAFPFDSPALLLHSHTTLVCSACGMFSYSFLPPALLLHSHTTLVCSCGVSFCPRPFFYIPMPPWYTQSLFFPTAPFFHLNPSLPLPEYRLLSFPPHSVWANFGVGQTRLRVYF